MSPSEETGQGAEGQRGLGAPTVDLILETALGVTAPSDHGLPCWGVLVPKPIPTLAVSLPLPEALSW